MEGRLATAVIRSIVTKTEVPKSFTRENAGGFCKCRRVSQKRYCVFVTDLCGFSSCQQHTDTCFHYSIYVNGFWVLFKNARRYQG